MISQTGDCDKVNWGDPAFKIIVACTEDLLSYLQLIELFLPLLVMCLVGETRGKN